MTEQTEQTEPTAASHLTLDELADVVADRDGDPGADEGADRRPGAHLAGCASCAARLRELEDAEAGVRASLTALPPPPLPSGLAERLQAALAAEPPLTRAAPAVSVDKATGPRAGSAGATVTPLASRRRQWLPAAAAAAVLVLGGALGWSVVQGADGAGDDTSSFVADAGAGAAAGATSALPTSQSGIDYADPAAVTSTLPQVLGGTAQRSAVGDSAPAADDTAESQAQTEAEAPTAAQPALPAPVLGAAAPDPLARLRDPAALASCLAALLPPEEPDVRPLALDYAQYSGTPALAVVLPDPDPTKVSVFLVGAGCSQADDSTLHFVRLDRP